MTNRTEPRILPGCTVLPPMESPNGSGRPDRTGPGTETTAKRTPDRRQTADRFAVLNAFVDSMMGTLSRNEIAVWMVLYRDTRNGIARTSQGDLARRAGVTDRTVRNVLRKLVDKGLVELVYRGGIGRGPSSYRIRPLPPDGERKRSFPPKTGKRRARPAEKLVSAVP